MGKHALEGSVCKPLKGTKSSGCLPNLVPALNPTMMAARTRKVLPLEPCA